MDQPERSAVDPTAEQFVTRLSRYASGPVRRQLERYLAAQDDAARRAAAESRGPEHCGPEHCGTEHCGTEHCGSEHRKLLGVPIRQVFVVGREFVELPVAELERLLGRAVRAVPAAARSHRQLGPGRSGGAARDRRLPVGSASGGTASVGPVRQSVGSPDCAAGFVAAGSGRRDRNAYALASLLADDPEDVVQKPIGGLLREVGRIEPARLAAFLTLHAARLRPSALRWLSEPPVREEPP